MKNQHDFTRTVCPGRTAEGQDVVCDISFEDYNLSISGWIMPDGGCGQIADSIKIAEFAAGWDEKSLKRFIEVWKRWHLNDMRAGCEHQRRGAATVELETGSRCPVCGYEYGSDWLREEVPTDVTDFLKSLPETTGVRTIQQWVDRWLRERGVRFETVYKRHGKHFPKDTESRDVYAVYFIRLGERISFDFGQSIANSTQSFNSKRKAPTAYDVITGLTKRHPGSFEEFCSDYGYDEESKQAERTYKACVAEYERLTTMFTDEELWDMERIQ